MGILLSEEFCIMIQPVMSSIFRGIRIKSNFILKETIKEFYTKYIQQA